MIVNKKNLKTNNKYNLIKECKTIKIILLKFINYLKKGVQHFIVLWKNL